MSKSQEDCREPTLTVPQESVLVQNFLSTLLYHGLGDVQIDSGGSLRSDSFNPASGLLSIPDIVFAPGVLSNDQLASFVVVQSIKGNLRLQRQPQLLSLYGLRRVRSVEGDLCIEDVGIKSTEDGFLSLEAVTGKIEIIHNKNLEEIRGFDRCECIGEGLVVLGNERLRVIDGFAALESIERGGLHVQNSLMLAKVRGFWSLRFALGVQLQKIGISDVDFLSPLIRAQPDFPGAIKINETNVEFLTGLGALRTTKSSLFLHGNKLRDISGLSNLELVGGGYPFQVIDSKMWDIFPS